MITEEEKLVLLSYMEMKQESEHFFESEVLKRLFNIERWLIWYIAIAFMLGLALGVFIVVVS